MPRKLGGKTLTLREHHLWVKVRAAARESGATSPEAVATAALKKARRKK